ncbi:MAG: endolytic transglycosylase MltG [Paludibacteraceae bacterium]|nr:endolytic transglycosylase MltG [Paludibacteraceae bacterium]
MKKAVKYGLISLILIAIGAVVVWGTRHYYHLMKSNWESIDGEKQEIYVYPNTSIEELQNVLSINYTNASKRHFMTHCKWLKFNFPETGHYILPERISDYELIKTFKYGNQTPINITFNNIRTTSRLASVLGQQLLTDSATIDSLLNDSTFLSEHKLNSSNAMLYFLPNTYQVYWTISGEQLFERMQSEYHHFWTPLRKDKASKIALTPAEVSTLASIVEEENTQHPDEWSRIAGLYLNRLRIGMPLQADPTVKYANGDMNITRVLNIHLQTESPYNTYLHKGLPPGPIRVPSTRAIDAVLNAEKHNYIFMCADYHLNGYHLFTNSSAQHARNAHLYQQELNKLKIFK